MGRRISTYRKLTTLLMLGAVAGALAVMPYAHRVSFETRSEVVGWPVLLFGQLVSLLAIFLCVQIGLRLGGRVGLGAPLLLGWVSGRGFAPGRLRRCLRIALVSGAAAGVVLTALGAAVEAVCPLPEFQVPTWALWEGLLGAFGAGITEELMFRLGLMTLFVWLIAKALRQASPGRAIMWISSALAALAFGFAHLPLLASLTEPTPATITLVLAGNGLVGLVFGWLYWRHGLLAAMTGHFATDVIIKAIVPMLH